MPKSIDAFPRKLCPIDISSDSSIDFSNAKFIWIPQGVACREAEVGVTGLMREILGFIQDTQQCDVELKPWKVCVLRTV